MENKNKLLPRFIKKEEAKCGPKSQSTTKHRMFRATNLCQSRDFYTNAVGDVGDIQKVCLSRALKTGMCSQWPPHQPGPSPHLRVDRVRLFVRIGGLEQSPKKGDMACFKPPQNHSTISDQIRKLLLSPCYHVSCFNKLLPHLQK